MKDMLTNISGREDGQRRQGNWPWEGESRLAGR